MCIYMKSTRRGWPCGWKSPLISSSSPPTATTSQHNVHPAAAFPAAPQQRLQPLRGVPTVSFRLRQLPVLHTGRSDSSGWQQSPNLQWRRPRLCNPSRVSYRFLSGQPTGPMLVPRHPGRYSKARGSAREWLQRWVSLRYWPASFSCAISPVVWSSKCAKWRTFSLS